MDTETTIKHLGGLGSLKAMINAREFSTPSDGLRFRYSGSRKANVVFIALEDDDTYCITIGRADSGWWTLKERRDGIYAEQLRETFEDMTGLALTI